MKKLLLILGMAVAGLATAQKFELTANNFVNSDDKTKEYIVLDFPNKTKKELFIASKKLINSTFENMNSKLYTEIEDEQITFSAFSPKSQLIMLNFAGSNIYHLYNKYEMNFKDGKIMIKPIFQYLTNFESNQENLSDLFKRKEAKLNKATSFINQETNSFTQNLQKVLNNSVNSDW